MSQPCSTHHDLVATLYIPGVCAQLSEPGHNAGVYIIVEAEMSQKLSWRDLFVQS